MINILNLWATLMEVYSRNRIKEVQVECRRQGIGNLGYESVNMIYGVWGWSGGSKKINRV